MAGIVDRHGGRVEKFIGDAVMAVFGVPVLHEDDALRAVRAAVAMRDALPELGLRGRIGVMTGEVVTGVEEHLATGDAVNVAARLEQAAQPGEVLIGEPTLALVRDSADVEPVGPLELKGKSEPVAAYRVLRVHAAPERPPGELFVGRERELGILREAWERVRAENRCELVTVTGDAGVGKSRLAAEALGSLDATITRGRCLPYGEGITYWPVVEVLKQLDVSPPDETAAAAIGALLGETEAPTSPEEIAWAFRKTLDHVAAERPLVVVFDDLQWGEQMFLDLIEHVALLSAGASILLLCMARPELAERRPTWPVTLRLEPLGDEDVDHLIPERIGGELRDKIARAAGGNPLFIEEMLAMAGEADGDVVVPPTLQALLGARLDQLDPAERSVLERGAIEGEIFHRGAVQALAPDDTQVTPRLAALVRKGLIRSDTPQLPGDDAFRFRHLLLRDAAYDALPKATRADLHQRFAAWLEERGSELVELDELVGYHLEQACPLPRRAWGARRRHAGRRGAAAADGRRPPRGRPPGLRAPPSACSNAPPRSSPPASSTSLLEVELGEALGWTGRADDALRRADALAERASAAGDRVGELCGRIQRGRVPHRPRAARAPPRSCPRSSSGRCQCSRRRATAWRSTSPTPRLRRCCDSRGQMEAGWRPTSGPSPTLGGRATSRPEPSPLSAGVASSARRPRSELLAWLDENEPPTGRDHFLRAYRAGALAMVGRFDESRAILAEERAHLAERGGGILLACITSFESVWLELLADDPVAAAEFGATGFPHALGWG